MGRVEFSPRIPKFFSYNYAVSMNPGANKIGKYDHQGDRPDDGGSKDL
jgi:hypothetical protein